MHEEDEGHDHHGSEPGIDAQLHIAITHEIRRHEQERGAGDGISQPPTERRQVDQPIEPSSADTAFASGSRSFVEHLQTCSVIVGQLAERRPHHQCRDEHPHSGEHPRSRGATSRDRVIDAGKPRGRQQPDPPGVVAQLKLAAHARHHLRNDLPRENDADRHQHLRRGHQAVQSLASEPAQAELIDQHNTTGAEQRFQNRREQVRHWEQPAAVAGEDSGDETGEIERARQPEGYLHQHADLCPEQAARCHRTVH